MSVVRFVSVVCLAGLLSAGCSSGDSSGSNADGSAGTTDAGDVAGEPCDYRGKSQGVCGGQTRVGDGPCPEPDAFEGPDEQTCDGLDNDCDGEVDEGCDDDGDRFCDAEMEVAEDRPDEVCPNGGGDCWDEANSEGARRTYPGAAQLDSESECLQDLDDDEHGAREPAGPEAVASGTDGCDDQPRAWTDQACSSCSDGDDDTYYSGCDTYLSQPEDCDDADDAVHPEASEACDGTDADCDGQSDDEDEDAHDACRSSDQTGWSGSKCVEESGSWCCTKEGGGTNC